MKAALTLLLLSTLMAVHASAAQETNLLVTSCFCSGASYFYEIPMSKASVLPQWNPESGAAAPLSMSSACALAKKALAARAPQLKQMEVRHIELWPVAKTGSWYYRIEGQGVRFDRYESPCGLMAVILMDGSNVEPRVTETASDLAEALKQASTNSFDYAGRMAQVFSGSTNALAQVLGFSRNVDPERAPGHGALLIEALGTLGDEIFAKVAGAQPADTKAAVMAHLNTGAAHTKIARLQQPVAVAFPLTYEALKTSSSGL